jgi:CBS domain-containing protein
MVTERDLPRGTLRDVDPREVMVDEAMSNHFAVDPDASLDVVAETMAEHRTARPS